MCVCVCIKVERGGREIGEWGWIAGGKGQGGGGDNSAVRVFVTGEVKDNDGVVCFFPLPSLLRAFGRFLACAAMFCFAVLSRRRENPHVHVCVRVCVCACLCECAAGVVAAAATVRHCERCLVGQ